MRLVTILGALYTPTYFEHAVLNGGSVRILATATTCTPSLCAENRKIF